MPSPSIAQDKELAEFFTDVEPLRGAFKDAVAAPTLTKRLFVIHGVGGVGKSSLLRMFRLHCKGANVPVALASGDDAKSALDVLVHWADDLKADGVAFSAFSKTHAHYRTLQAKVGTEAGKIAGQAIKGAAKTVIETAASTIPGVGPLLGKLGGTSVEALADILLSRGFKPPDIALLLDPTKKLTEDFLGDITKAADKRRVVLILDTFEQMTALEDWTRDISRCLHPNVLIVIAGRALPDWGRVWDSWQKHAQVEELKPMTEDVMRKLIQRYYATMRGGEPNPAQVESIIRFARGLPMVVTSAVQLWVKYGVEDFQSVKAEIVANLVDRLMEGVPNTLNPVLEAAAIVRWFDQPILRAVMKQNDVREVYNELRRFPFVRVRAEGLALHDAVREIMDENLRVQDSERHRELHERAAGYFEKRQEKVTGEEAERLDLERLYHRVCADEEAGINLFQEMAEGLARYRLLSRLQSLLNDVNTYPLTKVNSRQWSVFYNAKLLGFQARTKESESLHKAVAENESAEAKLRAYSLCNLGHLLSRWERLGQVGINDFAIRILEQSLSLAPLDLQLADSLLSLTRVFEYRGDWDKSIFYLRRAQRFFTEAKDDYGLVHVYDEEKRHCYIQGDWRGMLAMQKSGLAVLSRVPERPSFRATILGSWALGFVYAGRYRATEIELEESLQIHRQLGNVNSVVNQLRHLGFALGMQGKFEDGLDRLREGGILGAELGSDYRLGMASAIGFSGKVLGRQGRFAEAKDHLQQCLSIQQELKDDLGVVWVLDSLAELEENTQSLDKASNYYEQSIGLKSVGRRYFHCAALAGLVRVKHAQGHYAAIPPLSSEAEQLAQQYEYNDHLASLRLTQGHVAWEGNASSWDNGFEAALRFYQYALIYALRYNRFLLDEVLSGRPQGTLLRSVIPTCLERGDEGQQMLVALRDWWQMGVNDIGTPRPDTISPIPEGILLVEAERLAREGEPGDGSLQKSATEQIEAVLG